MKKYPGRCKVNRDLVDVIKIYLVTSVSGVRYGHTYFNRSKKAAGRINPCGFLLAIFFIDYKVGFVGRVAVSGISPLNILAPSPVNLK